MIEPGDKFGELTIVDIVVSRKSFNKGKLSSRKRFLCTCSCGKERIATGQYLRKTDNPRCIKCTMLTRPQSLKIEDLYLRPYGMHQNQAKRRDLETTLSLQDFKNLSTGNCSYCGDEAKLTKWTRGEALIMAGIDRVDPSMGYTLDNCVSCCKTCNISKMSMDKSFFLEHIKKICTHLNLIEQKT